jgi:hypothetical protein
MLGPQEQEMISTAVEGAVKGALAPVHDIVRDLAGPSASEIGATWSMQLRFWKIRRAARLAERVREYLEPIGINRRPVALKLLMGSVEHGAIEEEDELQDLWVALLASAADSREPEVHPSFPEILHELTARDAKLLMLIARMQLAIRNTIPYEPVKIIEIRSRSGECGFNPSDAGAFDFSVSAETLIRLRILEPRDVSEQSIDGRSQYGAYIVTNLGWAFLRAVMIPTEFQALSNAPAR